MSSKNKIPKLNERLNKIGRNSKNFSNSFDIVFNDACESRAKLMIATLHLQEIKKVVNAATDKIGLRGGDAFELSAALQEVYDLANFCLREIK